MFISSSFCVMKTS